MTTERKAREFLDASDGNARFYTLINGRWYVDEATALRAIARALTRPATSPSDEDKRS